MARFQHPYVVALYDANLDDPQGPCIVMEYIRGAPLDHVLKKNTRFTPARVDRLLGQLCEALHAAHSEGIVHRDLKPSNLMVVDADTPYEKLKVMDFGLAKLVENANGMAMFHKTAETGHDFAVGTPGYISPEQVRGDVLDFRCDLYSVGIILFELLTGRLPFKKEETMEVLFAHAMEPPPTFEQVNAAGWVPRPVEDVVMRCLAKKPEDRPASARDLATQFHDALLMAREFETAAPSAAETPTVSEMPATAPAHTPTALPTPVPFDANTIVHHVEAWMPDSIASYKLRGFVHDSGGSVLESVPGRIRVRLGSQDQGGGFGWFGFTRKQMPLDVELRLERLNPQQPNLLHITVIMSSPDRRALQSAHWREHCNHIYCELRSYLAGSTVG
jgi:serine/threonine-protein kinase